MGTTRTTTQTHQSTNTSQNQGSNVMNYTDPMMQKFAQAQMGQIQNAEQLANQPVYGQAQVNQYLGGLNDLANNSIKNLQANLARRGVGGNSGALGQGITDIDTSRMGQASNFMGQLPFMNRAATMQALPGLFGAAAQQQSVAPKRQDYSGSQSGQNSGEDVTKAKGSWLDTVSQIAGIVGQVGGAAMGMPGLGGLAGKLMGGMGGGGGQQFNMPGGVPGGTDQYMNYSSPAYNPLPMAPPPIGQSPWR